MLDTQSILLLTPIVLQLFGLGFAVWSDPYIRRDHRRTMLIITALIAALIARDLAGFQLDRASIPTGRTLLSIVGYSLRPLLLLLFCRIVSDRKDHWLGWALVALNAAVHATALFSPLCFSYNPDGLFIRGPLGFTCHVIGALLLCELLYRTVKFRAGGRRDGIWIPLFNAALIVAAVVVDTFFTDGSSPLSFLNVAMVSASMFYYIWLHLQFVREHERALMAEQRIQIMMSQIQPHFLYNTLATIKALCRKDPEMAAAITEKFGVYLRRNLDSLGQSELIPFEKELEHTRIYADIEMVRFDTIRVEYDVRDIGFSVPPLTLQPLVENAIRHGVRIREEGLVRILTRRRENCHEIVVEDNGAGFDVSRLDELGESHIGIRNVRERLEKMCGGTLLIESRSGEGTTAVIRIPAES